MPYKNKEDKRAHNIKYRLANQHKPEWKEYARRKQRKYDSRKRKERELLLFSMTSEQRKKFIANEKKIRLERKRNRIVNLVLTKQIERLNQIKAIKEDKLTEKQRLEMETKKIQIESLNIQKRIFLNKQIDKVIIRLKQMKESRLHRYSQMVNSPRNRYLWAIDYYYELVRQNTMKAA